MQTVWKQNAHLRKADGIKLDTYANFMKSRSFDSKKREKSEIVYKRMLINAKLRTGKRG